MSRPAPARRLSGLPSLLTLLPFSLFLFKLSTFQTLQDPFSIFSTTKENPSQPAIDQRKAGKMAIRGFIDKQLTLPGSFGDREAPDIINLGRTSGTPPIGRHKGSQWSALSCSPFLSSFVQFSGFCTRRISAGCGFDLWVALSQKKVQLPRLYGCGRLKRSSRPEIGHKFAFFFFFPLSFLSRDSTRDSGLL